MFTSLPLPADCAPGSWASQHTMDLVFEALKSETSQAMCIWHDEGDNSICIDLAEALDVDHVRSIVREVI